MVTFDSFFQKQYDRRAYNCLHFFVEFWRDYLEIDLSFILPQENELAQGREGIFELARLRLFRLISKPAGLCAVLMRNFADRDLHIGTYLDGRVLHIDQGGVYYLPLEVAAIGFKSVSCYEYVDHH